MSISYIIVQDHVEKYPIIAPFIFQNRYPFGSALVHSHRHSNNTCNSNNKMAPNALDLIDAAIADLEAKLNLAPGGILESKSVAPEKAQTKADQPNQNQNQKGKKEKKEKKPKNNNNKQAASKKNAPANTDQPDICKLEFKVGVITKVWVHPDADKLYCEEIDCGEDQPRQIASGLRMHYSEEAMLGQRLLVVSNLKVSIS